MIIEAECTGSEDGLTSNNLSVHQLKYDSVLVNTQPPDSVQVQEQACERFVQTDNLNVCVLCLLR